MSSFQFFGAMEMGLIYALVAMGVLISFRVLDFPDLTVDGSFTLGAALVGVLILGGVHPWIASALAFAGGCCAGLVTAWMNVRWKILHLLASILTMIALYSVNLRVMGRPNISLLNEETIFVPFHTLFGSHLYGTLFLVVLVAVVTGILFWLFMISETGLAMRATGANPRMAQAQGIYTSRMIILGVCLGNGLVALAGSLFAQSQGFADISLGQGTIIVGLASVIIGEVIIPGRRMWVAVLGCIAGSIIYRLLTAIALNTGCLGLQASDLNLVTALLVGFAMVLPRLRTHMREMFARRNA